MSKIQAKPYIEKVVATLTEAQRTSLLSLINGSDQTPAFRSLVNTNNLITGADEGVSHIVLETWNKTYTGYLLYNDTYCVLVAYSNNTQELNIVKINLANRTYNLVKEVLTILEFRYIVGGSSGVGVDVTVDEINSGSATAGKVIVADGEGGAEWGTAGMENPMTTAGDIIVGGASGTPTRLATGTEGQVLKVGASGLEWATDSDSELPALTDNAGKVLAVNSGATGTEWVSVVPATFVDWS